MSSLANSIKTHELDPVFINDNRVEFRLPNDRAYLSNLRIAGLSITGVNNNSQVQSNLSYPASIGAWSSCRNIYLYNDNVVLSQLLEAPQYLAMNNISRSNANSYNLAQNLVKSNFGFNFGSNDLIQYKQSVYTGSGSNLNSINSPLLEMREALPLLNATPYLLADQLQNLRLVIEFQPKASIVMNPVVDCQIPNVLSESKDIVALTRVDPTSIQVEVGSTDGLPVGMYVSFSNVKDDNSPSVSHPSNLLNGLNSLTGGIIKSIAGDKVDITVGYDVGTFTYDDTNKGSIRFAPTIGLTATTFITNGGGSNMVITTASDLSAIYKKNEYITFLAGIIGDNTPENTFKPGVQAKILSVSANAIEIDIPNYTADGNIPKATGGTVVKTPFKITGNNKISFVPVNQPQASVLYSPLTTIEVSEAGTQTSIVMSSANDGTSPEVSFDISALTGVVDPIPSGGEPYVVASDMSKMTYSFNQPTLLVDEILDAGKLKNSPIDYISIERQIERIPSVSSGDNQIIERRLRAYDGKFLSKLIYMNTKSNQVDGLGATYSQAMNKESINFTLNGIKYIPFGGIDTPALKISQMNDTKGAINAPVGSLELSGQDNSSLIYEAGDNNLALAGNLSYGAVNFGSVIDELILSYQRTGDLRSNSQSEFNLVMYGEVIKTLKVSNNVVTITG